MIKRFLSVQRVLVLSLWLPLAGSALAQSSRVPSGSRSMITRPVDETQLKALLGSTRPEANALNDRGRVDDGMVFDHLFLQLRRPPEQELALNRLIDALHDPSSPNFHKWLTAAEFGAYGLAEPDLNVITAWMGSHGLKVNGMYNNNVLIDFAATAGRLREAFHVEIDRLIVDGVPHFANMSDPLVPSALAVAVVGVVSLNDFFPRPAHVPRPDYTTSNQALRYLVSPADLAKIYNLGPLFKSKIDGTGQTIAILEDTDLYSDNADFATFQQTFGLAQYGGSLTTNYPNSSGNSCVDPGTNADEDEAALDVEWASAAAPSASIVLEACASQTTPGYLIALQNLVDATVKPPAIMSLSYGECESSNRAEDAQFNSAYQEGVARGVSIFVSAGDNGAAGCDNHNSGLPATHGIAVNGLASTPFNVAVGGTDFGDTYALEDAQYWSSTNSGYYESAKSYIPEIAWNDSCASQLLSQFRFNGSTFGPNSYCNTPSTEPPPPVNVDAGSGGASSCALPGCTGYSKPTWQSGVFGILADGVRDLPDVSLFSGSGTWRHAYVYCFSDSTYKKEDDPKPCTGSPYNWSIAGGTSFATPILAGIQALVNQKNGAYQGNPNYVYYRLAAAEYGVIGSSSCNSTLGNAASSSCIFYDLTLGDTDVPCTGSSDCYNAGGEYGILSTSDYAPERVFEAAIGWDFATGIGSVNALNLVMNWNSGKNPYSPPSVTPIYEFPAASQGLIGPRGSEPLGGLTLGKGGVLYGSTCLGGSIGGGTIFSLTPPKSATGTWSQSVLYSFSGETDAGCPSGTLAIDANGVLYGTALGNGGLGFVYSLTPPVEGGAPWTEITLYAFAGELDGGEPQGGLLIYNGALFGTTSLGGSAGNNGSGWGTVFELSPPPSGSGSWIEAVIYRFGGAPDGAIPNGQLTIDAGGVLYGTTVEGGEGLGDGTVFSLSPPLPRSNSWTENILYSFQDSPDGAQPSGGLEFIGQNLVGVTGGGGSLTCNRGVGCGIVYELFPPKVAGLPWTEANLYSFGGGFDGDSPSGNLVFDNAGNLYGATMFGGTASGLGYGTLYELSSPTQSGAPWGYVRLYNFLGGPDGCYINGNLILGGKGVLYGTAESCGTGIIDDGNGTVFEAQY